MDTQNGAPAPAIASEREAPEDLSADLSEDEARDRLVYAVALGHRIRELRGEMSRVEMAEKIGIHTNTLGKFERGASQPDALQIQRMCQLRGRSIEWLVTGTEHADLEPQRSVSAVEYGGYVYVPLFDVHASAGGGAFNDVERVIAMRPFDARYIRDELHILHDEIALVSVTGSSSEPVLHSGDTVMVDRRDREVRAEGLHLLLVDDALLVKLVQRLPGRVLRVSSRNEAFPAFDVRLDDESQANVHIVGRVRWGGVTFH